MTIVGAVLTWQVSDLPCAKDSPEEGPSQHSQLLQLAFGSLLEQVNAPEGGHEVQALTSWRGAQGSLLSQCVKCGSSSLACQKAFWPFAGWRLGCAMPASLPPWRAAGWAMASTLRSPGLQHGALPI